MSNNLDESMQQIMLNYLSKTYPIKKIRDGRRFKRGIVSDYDEKYFLKPTNEANRLFSYLSNDLTAVFSPTKLEINMVLLKYLGLL
jgi:hypothetical protein